MDVSSALVSRLCEKDERVNSDPLAASPSASRSGYAALTQSTETGI